MKFSHSKRGYTLIELMVAVAIFALIMLLATSAYFALIYYTKQARATSVVMTNLSFAVDSMVREIRAGKNYTCSNSDSAPYTDCASGGTAISFLAPDKDTCGNAQYYTYILAQSAIMRCIASSPSAVCSAGSLPSSGCGLTDAGAVQITDPSISVSSTSLPFYVRGTGTAPSDTIQPMITVILQGSTAVPHGQPVTFSIQGSATQRYLDL